MTTTHRTGPVRWKSSQDLLEALHSLYPPGASPDEPPPGARVLKDGPVRTVYRIDHDGFGGTVLVKRYRPGTLPERFRDLIRRSVAESEWRAAKRLLSLGVPVAEPLAAGVPRRLGIPYGSLYVCRFLEGAASIHELLIEGKADRALWTALGGFVSDLHKSDFFHPDLHLGTILARRIEGEWSLSVVDLHTHTLTQRSE